jgi:hypothetical protein
MKRGQNPLAFLKFDLITLILEAAPAALPAWFKSG